MTDIEQKILKWCRSGVRLDGAKFTACYCMREGYDGKKKIVDNAQFVGPVIVAGDTWEDVARILVEKGAVLP